MKPELTQARLKEALHYEPETGVFTWRAHIGTRARPGVRAGSLCARDGYCRVRLDRRMHLAHRLAFLYMTGVMPLKDVDHINRVRADNRWCNLRPATAAENAANRGLRSDSTSGRRGVTWHKKTQKWQAHGMLHGRKIYLGLYTVLEEAAVASQKWREENFAEFAPA